MYSLIGYINIIQGGVKINGVEKVNAVCDDVLKLSESDFEEAIAMSKKQTEYSHPMKMATTIKQHALGEYNLRVITALIELRCFIESGNKI